MKKQPIFILAFIILSLIPFTAFAWTHSIEVGYGYSHDPNHTKYNNSGVLLTGDLMPLKRTESTLWTLNAGLGQWFSTAPKHTTLTTAALALALRYYIPNYAPYFDFYYPPYVLASAGPSVMSSNKFGENVQGSNFTFQLNAGLGMEFKNIDVNLRMVHFSNAHIFHPDHGFNILYMLSIGYLY